MAILSEENRVLIFDTTLRDGEQCPGATMTLHEKLQIAEILDRMGVDIIEAGFPMASNGDFEAVRAIAQRTENSTICALARASRKDIERAAEALDSAANKRIHTFISTSPLHMKYKLQMEPDSVYDAVVDSISYARNLCDDVEWGVEDATRSEPDFLCRLAEAAIKAGASTINIADTVGYTLPHEFSSLIQDLLQRVPGIDEVRISVHCHDDLGLATANSLSAVQAGARQVECTINGLGERAGNASLEEIVMGLKTRHDAMPYHTGIDTEFLTETSRLVSSITGFVVPPNKAIVGSNAFAHESGIHQHGVISHRGTYEIINPEAVGASGTRLVMGKHSGRHALRVKLSELGYTLGENGLAEAFERFKTLADSKKEISDQEIGAIAEEIIDTVKDATAKGKESIAITSLEVITTADAPAEAKISLSLPHTIEEMTATAQGDGSFVAIINAIKKIVPHENQLAFVRLNGLSTCANTQTKVTLQLNNKIRDLVGEGSGSDPNMACARAYVHALNQCLYDGDNLLKHDGEPSHGSAVS